MKNLFVPYEIAKQLKEKGFNEKCLGWWFKYYDTANLHLVENDEGEDNNLKLDLSSSQAINARQLEQEYESSCSAPLYQQVIDWFREKHNILIHWEKDEINNKRFVFYPHNGSFEPVFDFYNGLDKSIEEALKLI